MSISNTPAQLGKPTHKPLTEDVISRPEYDPCNLLDALILRANLKNDAALSRYLEVAPPVISKIRHRKLPVGDSMLIRMHDMTGVPVNELRAWMGIAPVAARAQ